MFGVLGVLGGDRVIEFLDFVNLHGGPVVLDLGNFDVEVGF